MEKHNYSIHGLRGLLAITVVIFHVYRGLVSDGYLEVLENATWIESLGRVSVNLFFVISGYLIFQSLIKHRNVKTFFVNRILRIYPVFLVIHVFVFIAGPIINFEWMANLSFQEYVIHFVSNLLLLPGIFPSLPAAQIVAWSISYEVLFYLLVGTFFMASHDFSTTKNKFLLSTTMLVSIVFVFYHPRALFFGVGILVYFFIDMINEKRTYKPIYYLNGAIALCFLIFFYERMPLVLSLILSFFIFISVVNQEGMLARILRTKLFSYLGNISYSLYLWHTFAFFPIKHFVIPRIAIYVSSPSLIFTFFLITGVSASIVVSHFSYVILEKKLTKIIKKKMEKKSLENKNEADIV